MNGFVFLAIVLAVGVLIVSEPYATPWLNRKIDSLEAKRRKLLGRERSL